MKKFLMLLAIVAFTGSVAFAQCTGAKKTAKTVSTDLQEKKVCTVAAAKMASLDENISSKTCAVSGKTSFYKKSVCAKSGKVSMTEVHYSSKAKGFVNVSPSEMEATATKASLGAKKACTKGAATCTKGKAAKATKVSLSAKKACTKGAATCTKGKGAKATKVALNASKKSCCSSGKVCTKPCCAGKTKTASTAVKAKLVKSEK